MRTFANLERRGSACGATRRSRARSSSPGASARHRSDPSREGDLLPLVGQIAAGGPLLAAQDIEEYVSVPGVVGPADFVLRVKGDSMVDAGILDGDYVIVRRQQDATNGDIVVALVGEDEVADEATVKRFFRDNGRIRLQPENETLEPIFAEHVELLGKVVGMYRKV